VMTVGNTERAVLAAFIYFRAPVQCVKARL
jgi:hypothetical protein